MRTLHALFENNRAWAATVRTEDPTFFSRLSEQQHPSYFWIGCSDSRVPANRIVDVVPGELFVHRNIANLVIPTDLNCLSVMQYAVDALKVEHIIVCGHHGCGGVKAAMQNRRMGLVDNWLQHVKNVQRKHHEQLGAIEGPDARLDRLCELNVIEQVLNVCQSTVVLDAWDRGQDLAVHGWIYRISDGLLRDLGVSAGSQEQALDLYRDAVAPPAR